MALNAPALGLLLVALLPAAEQPAADPAERCTLENGLRVVLRPVKGAALASVTVLFDFGEDADPEGRSGLAHLCEHLYCTSPAGGAKATPVEEIVRTHPGGWNAQTGRDYTVFSFVVTPAALDAELEDAARRLGALAPAAEDLAREKPRLLDELENMYGRSPGLAAWNHCREFLRPERAGRAGGLPEEVFDVPLEEAVAFLRAKYRPAAARLVVAGAFDPAVLGPRIRERFGAIPARPAAGPPPAKALAAWLPAPTALAVVGTGPDGFRQGPQVALGWNAPRPDHPDYPAYLLLVLRLWSKPSRAEKETRDRPAAIFAPLDDPEHLCVRAGIGREERPLDAARRAEAWVRACVDAPFAPGEERLAKVHLGNMLGTLRSADALVAANPYLAGYGLGRRDQLGIDGAALAKALDGVTEESLAAARKKWFGEPVRVAAIPD